MKFGIGSYAYAWSIGVPGSWPENPMTAFDLIDKAVALQVKCVQIDDNIPLYQFSQEVLSRLQAYAREKRVEVEIGTRRLSRENVMNHLEIAAFFDSPFLRVVIDDQQYQPSEAEINILIKEIMPEFEKKGIYLAIENHDRFKAATFLQIIEAVNSKYLKICLDSVNSLGAGEGIEEVTNLLAAHTINVHLKEFKAERLWHNMGFLVDGRPLGQGHLPIGWILEKVGSGCKSVTLELWPAPEDDLQSTIKKENQWVQESVNYWKEHFATE